MKQLSPLDSLFVFNEYQNAPLHGSPILIYDPSTAPGGFVRFKDILATFESRLHLSPVFRRTLVRVPFHLDNPYWVEDENFDLEFHVRHIALPKPGDWRQFCILVSRLHSRQLDLSRPPWEAYIIEGLDNVEGLPSGSYALYLKVHHAAMDGATSTQIIDALHDLTATPEDDQGPDHWQGEQGPSELKMLGTAYLNLLRKPSKILSTVRQVARSAYQSHRSPQEGASTSHKFKEPIRFNEPIGPHRVFGGVNFELDRVKAIKNQIEGTTINDVMLTVIGGALRSYLQSSGELPDSALLAAVPINTRTEDQMTAEGGNEVSAMAISLRSDVENPAERLTLVHEDAVASKAYSNAVGADLMANVAESLPTAVASLGLRAAAETSLLSRFPRFHTVVTNVPGPRRPLYMCGAKVLSIYGAGCPISGVGLFNAINSYCGRIAVSFVTDREMMPDPEFYQACIQESIEALETAVAARPSAGKHPSRKPGASRKRKNPAKKNSAGAA